MLRHVHVKSNFSCDFQAGRYVFTDSYLKSDELLMRSALVL